MQMILMQGLESLYVSFKINAAVGLRRGRSGVALAFR